MARTAKPKAEKEPQVLVTETRAEYNARVEADESAKNAKPLPEHSIMEQHTDIPVGPDPKQVEQKRKQEEDERKAADLQFENAQKAQQAADDARQGKGQWGDAAKEWTLADMRPVRLLKGYVPMEAYSVIEGQTAHLRTKPATRTHDKIQSGQVIGLPLDEAKRVIAAGVAERVDELQ